MKGKKTLRNSLLVIITLLLLSLVTVNGVLAAEPQISAQAAVLIDRDTGAVLYGKNHLETRPPASTTKILTAILAIEKGNLSDVVVVSQRAALTGEARLNLVAGEKITLENLLYGALLKSGNDACVAIAEHIASSVEDFVSLMNLKAKSIGCTNSHFVNPHGLPAKNHYSTALDLAILAGYALDNPIFAKIVATPEYTVRWEESFRTRHINNTNRLLHIYPGATGVKTGTTNAAGQCLVSSASRDNRNLIAVVLKSQNRFGDSVKLLDYGFQEFRNLEVVQKGKISSIDYEGKKIKVKTGDNLIITLSRNQEVEISYELKIKDDLLKQPIAKDQLIGYINYYNQGEKIGQVPLLSLENVEISKVEKLIPGKFWRFLQGKFSLKGNY